MQTGVTALLAASLKGQTEVADLLLKANASVDTLTIDVSEVVFVFGAWVVHMAYLPTGGLVVSELVTLVNECFS